MNRNRYARTRVNDRDLLHPDECTGAPGRRIGSGIRASRASTAEVWHRTVIAGVASAVLLASVAPLSAQDPGVQQQAGGVTLNFQDTDLSYVFTALAAVVGLNIVLSNIPQQNVTLRTVQPVPTEDVSNLIQSLAGAHGIAVYREGSFLRLQGAPEDEPPDDRQLFMIQLRHARAPILAGTLQQLFGGGGSGLATQQQQGRGGRGTLSQQLSQLTVNNAQGLNAAQQAQAALRAQVLLQAGGALVGDVIIVPDEMTNSLLVRAAPADWQIIQQAIQGLDLRPLQALIEVLVVEVRHSDDLNAGVSFLVEDDDGSPSAELPGLAGEGDFVLRVFSTGDVNVDAALNALSATGNVRILSRPIVFAQNNQQATITVGSERPFVQSSIATPTGDQGLLTQTVVYRDVATILDILPTINPDGYVNMLLTQTVSSATNETQFGAPVISTREATTQVLARDGQTVVIGGLVDHQEERSRIGIPFLKDIPVLGFFFGTTRVTTGNNELFLFLTPHIVATDADADRLRRELEQNATLLKDIAPIQSLIPPANATLPGDTTGARGAGAGRGGRGGGGGLH